MKSLPSNNSLSIIYIWQSTSEANHVLLSNNTLIIVMTSAFLYDEKISITIDQGIAVNNTCTPACSSLIVNLIRQILEAD
jgi:hypothetical protein